MAKLSVLIPARNELYLSKTVDDIFKHAVGEVEVIAMLDGYWPAPPLADRPNLILVHRGQVHGMQSNINSAARIATGKYVMKSDAHCMFAKGFDEVLKAACEPDWLVVPSRYNLDAERWKRGTRGPIDYLTLTFPYTVDDLYGTGFHGKKWHGPHGLEGSYWHLENERKNILIDDILMFQGSCWFMHRAKFFDIECMDEGNYHFAQEAQELGMKVWLSGGRVVRNKKTWYAHLHKGKKHGRGFRLSKRQTDETELYSTDFWMNNRWPKQTRKLEWLIDKFGPLDGWPEDWQDPKHAIGYKRRGAGS